MSKTVKIILIVIIALFAIGALCVFLAIPSVINDQGKKSDSANTEAQYDTKSEIKSNVVYEIVMVDDSSLNGGKIVRKSVIATIPKDTYFNMQDDELVKLSQQITDDYATENKVNALSVFLYTKEDRNKNGEGAFPIASCHYYPEGDIAKASDVESGDYSKFTYECDVTSKADYESMMN